MVSFPILMPLMLFWSDTPIKIVPPFVLEKATADSMVRSSNFSLNSNVSDSPVLMRSGRFIFLVVWFEDINIILFCDYPIHINIHNDFLYSFHTLYALTILLRDSQTPEVTLDLTK